MLPWKHRESAKYEHQIIKKMAYSRFALSNRNIVEQLKENAKNKNTLKATQTWLNVWQTWATQRKVNPKMEEYEHEQLDKMLPLLITEI